VRPAAQVAQGLDADRVGTGVAVGLIQGPGKAVGVALQGQSRESREGGDAAPQHGMQNSQQKDQALRPHERPVGLAQRLGSLNIWKQGKLLPRSWPSCWNQPHAQHSSALGNQRDPLTYRQV